MEALALTDANDPDRPALALVLGYAGRLVEVDDATADLLRWAVDAFVAQGDPAHAAEAASLLGNHLFYLGDVMGLREARDRVLELARVVPASPSTVRAFASASRSFNVIDHDYERALETAREALRLAEEIGDDEAASIALNTIGMARVYGGDADGLDDLEQSVERAARAGSVFHVHGALNNLGNTLWHVGRLEEGSARIHEARALDERYGFETALAWNDSELAYDALFRGDLDAVLDWADEVLARDPSEVGYQLRPMLATRAWALLARARLDEAVADAEAALAGLREGGADAQVAPFVLTTVAQTFRAAGREKEADDLFAEVLSGTPDESIFDLPLQLVELGRGDEYLALTEGKPGHLWQDAGRAAAAGDLVAASEIYRRIGARFAEAWAALLAAERGDTSHLEAALAYFEEQQATPYVQRCRALLQASA
jgi:tetratricopeptide (TPR) repeat protein